jgi:hypothetical protein
MIDRAGELQAKRPCHAALVSGMFVVLQDLTLALPDPSVPS